MKRIFALVLAFTLSFCALCSPAFASEGEGQNLPSEAVSVYEIEPRKDTPPTDFKNLAGNNNYEGTLIDLAAGRGSYTKYYFATGTGNIYVKMDLMRSGTTTTLGRSLQVRLYEKETANSAGVWTQTRDVSFETSDATKRVVFAGLSADKFYYISFYNTSSSSTGSRLDISGTALIDDTYN